MAKNSAFRCLREFCIFLLIALLINISEAKPKNSAGFYSLKKGNLHVNITDWGATLVALSVPDAKGKMADVLLGFDSISSYQKKGSGRPYFGAVVGRVANRIKDAKFTLDGITYLLPKNDGNNTLHGGLVGYDNVLWNVDAYKPESEYPYLKLSYFSKDGEQGFPGDLQVSARYTITRDMTVRLDMEAVALNKATPVSLINHAYWNLAGQNSGKSILNHTIKIWASKYTPSTPDLIPTGQILGVKGTPMDLRKTTPIGSRINKVVSNEHPRGFDHNYVLDAPMRRSGLRPAARVEDPWSKRVMEVWTSSPGLQFYTSNNLPPTVGKGGFVYKSHSAFCLETQKFPNSVNQPNFPSVIVKPGQKYKHTALFKFSVDN